MVIAVLAHDDSESVVVELTIALGLIFFICLVFGVFGVPRYPLLGWMHYEVYLPLS